MISSTARVENYYFVHGWQKQILKLFVLQAVPVADISNQSQISGVLGSR